MVIAIDFDGTITEKNIFPEIGKAREHAFEAINWLARNNVKMDAYNENLYSLQSRKIVADVYIDDKNVFMVDDVDWYKIEEYILSLGNKEIKIIKDEA